MKKFLYTCRQLDMYDSILDDVPVKRQSESDEVQVLCQVTKFKLKKRRMFFFISKASWKGFAPQADQRTACEGNQSLFQKDSLAVLFIYFILIAQSDSRRFLIEIDLVYLVTFLLEVYSSIRFIIMFCVLLSLLVVECESHFLNISLLATEPQFNYRNQTQYFIYIV